MKNKRRKRFNSLKNAELFAKKVNGQVNDLRSNTDRKSDYSVTYVPDPTRNHYLPHEDWLPEEGKDFGYPNEYWQ